MADDKLEYNKVGRGLATQAVENVLVQVRLPWSPITREKQGLLRAYSPAHWGPSVPRRTLPWRSTMEGEQASHNESPPFTM